MDFDIYGMKIRFGSYGKTGLGRRFVLKSNLIIIMLKAATVCYEVNHRVDAGSAGMTAKPSPCVL